MNHINPMLNRRNAGVLLHITSLPAEPYPGKLGSSALRFVDLLLNCGLRVWQMLPLGPTHDDNSPYQSLSVSAGSGALISVEWLLACGWIKETFAQTIVGDDVSNHLPELFQHVFDSPTQNIEEQFREFCRLHHKWLQDYAEFRVLRNLHNNASWSQWPEQFRIREAGPMDEFRQQHETQLDLYRFEQFLFYTQWHELKQYANERGILLFGDVPIFVSYDSADVWAHRDQFNLDENGEMPVIAGVPPDYFSETGQRWGNPHYDWQHMQKDGFQWWLQRFASQLELFDLIRVDHFRGFEACWEVPAEEETAINGHWVKVPGQELFHALQQQFGRLPLVAEDLGIITDEVTALREQFDLPGMKILQFAFDGNENNPYLPHNHELNSVVYTGTHDNDTTAGWLETLNEQQQKNIKDYYCHPGDDLPWVLVQSALASVARLAIVPMQDFLLLGSDFRMNVPGTTEGNWRWELKWEQVPDHLPAQVRTLVGRYGRG